MCEEKQKRIQVFRDKRKALASEIRELRARGKRPCALSNLSRHLHLACGFFRHRAYSTMEVKAHTTPHWDSIKIHVQKYGTTTEDANYESEMARLETWLQDARDHYESQKPT